MIKTAFFLSVAVALAGLYLAIFVVDPNNLLDTFGTISMSLLASLVALLSLKHMD